MGPREGLCTGWACGTLGRSRLWPQLGLQGLRVAAGVPQSRVCEGAGVRAGRRGALSPPGIAGPTFPHTGRRAEHLSAQRVIVGEGAPSARGPCAQDRSGLLACVPMGQRQLEEEQGLVTLGLPTEGTAPPLPSLLGGQGGAQAWASAHMGQTDRWTDGQTR